jgi:predicted nucleic acid-binding OB-fold protein
VSIASLHFFLPRENQEFLAASCAGRLTSAIDEISQHIRSRIKYQELGDEARSELELVRAVLSDATAGLPEDVLL